MSGLSPVGKCFFCGKEVYDGSELHETFGSTGHDDYPVAHKEHLHPKSRGGGNHAGNIVHSCRSCNSRKKEKTLEEFRTYLMREKPEAKAAEKLMEVAEQFDLPENSAIQRAAGRLLERVDKIKFYGETHG